MLCDAAKPQQVWTRRGELPSRVRITHGVARFLPPLSEGFYSHGHNPHLVA
jgi:hypothetical protein